ncbi:MAG: amino acid ABC transporter permease [Nonomuraea sp.]|nr:amino acid ABC transporter permease [Nonomuraea sp.]
MDELLQYAPGLLVGFGNNLKLSVVVGIFSLIVGTILAAMRVSPIPVLRATGTTYVNILRNTPLTLVLAFCSLGLSDTLGLIFSQEDPSTNAFWLAVLGMSAYTSTFVCEVLRSGVNTVPMGQAEAARAIGLTFTQSASLIIFPQAFRTVIAPLGSVFIAMIKNTTVVAAAGYTLEVANVMRTDFDTIGVSIPIFLGIVVAFVVIILPLGYFTGWLSRRLAVAR